MQGYRLQTCVLRANRVVPPRRNKAANRLRKLHQILTIVSGYRPPYVNFTKYLPLFPGVFIFVFVFETEDQRQST